MFLIRDLFLLIVVLKSPVSQIIRGIFAHEFKVDVISYLSKCDKETILFTMIK